MLGRNPAAQSLALPVRFAACDRPARYRPLSQKRLLRPPKTALPLPSAPTNIGNSAFRIVPLIQACPAAAPM